MELRTYLAILWRRKWVIAVTVAATLVVVVIGTLSATPIYQASTTLRVLTVSGGRVEWPQYNIPYAERLINTYSELISSGPVLGELVQRLGLDGPPQIEVEVIANTELMKIVVEDANPRLAREVANVLAQILVAQSEELQAGNAMTAQQTLYEQLAQVEEELDQAQKEYESLVSQLPEDSERIRALSHSISLKREAYSALLEQYGQTKVTEAMEANALSIIEPAAIPQAPSKPRKTLNVALGFIVGLVGGVGLAFLFEHLDTRLHTVEQIEAVTIMPALGRIPRTRKRPQDIFLNGDSPQREAYRHLRTSIYATAQGDPQQTLLVTSAEPREGKSAIVTNLAYVIAQSGHRVIAVDGDLRRPTLHSNFYLSNRIGLSMVLEGKARLQEAVRDTRISGVSVLTSGPLPPNPAELLGSHQMRALLEEMRQHFDMILVDAPALLPVTDAAVLAPMVDGVLLVVGCGQSGREAVRSACRELNDVGASLVGLVVNRANQSPGHRYYDYYRLPDEALRVDPLTRISGIGPVYEKALNALGIVSFAQLAEQDPETLAENMGVQITAERISRDRWVEQAEAWIQRKSCDQASADGNRPKPVQGGSRWSE